MPDSKSERVTPADIAAARLFQSETSLLPLRIDNANTPEQFIGRTALRDAFLIRLERIEPDPEQPRRYLEAEALEELTRSIREQGVLQPISVRYVESAKCYRIVSGERRYQASKRAGLESIPCILQNASEREILVAQITENWVRSDLHAFEVSDSLAALRDRHNFTQADISRMIGKSPAEVSKFLGLLTLSPEAQAACRADRSGRLTRSHLEALVKVPEAEQLQMVERVQAGNLTAKETQRVVQERVARSRGEKTQGAPIGATFRYKTTRAQVVISFRRATATSDDLLDALADVRRQIEGKSGLEMK